MKASRNTIALPFIAVLLSACGSGSNKESTVGTPEEQALAPRTITYYSETGEPRAVEQFFYGSGSAFQSSLFTDNGADNLWGTDDDIATGHTECHYENQGFIAPVLQPLFLIGMSETETGQTVLKETGIDPQDPALYRCPQRLLRNLIAEIRQCESPECLELLGPVQSLHISNTQLPGRTLEQQVTVVPFSSGSHSEYFAFTQTAQILYSASGTPGQINEITTAPVSPYGNDEVSYLVQLASENCPASPSAEQDLTPTEVACHGLKREREITLNDFEARITSQRYHGLYPNASQQEYRYFDGATQRIYDLSEGQFPPAPEENEVAVTDFSEEQVVRRYTLTQGTDDIWFNEDDGEQELYRATMTAQGHPVDASLPHGHYQFYYTSEGRPLRIDYVEDTATTQQIRFFYPGDGAVTIEELFYSEEIAELALRTRAELAPQSSIPDFVGNFPLLPKAHSVPDLRNALYGNLLDGDFPSLALLRSQNLSSGELQLQPLLLTGIQMVDLALGTGQVSGVTLTGLNLGGGIPIIVTGH